VKCLVENGVSQDSGHSVITGAREPALPLHRACFGGYFDVAQYLIQQGANVNRNLLFRYFATPLTAAVASGCVRTVRFLLEHHANPNLWSVGKSYRLQIPRRRPPAPPYRETGPRNFPSPLAWGVFCNRLEIVKLLLEAGADVNESGELVHKSPLGVALDLGHVDIAALLRESGAIETKRDKEEKKWDKDDYKRMMNFELEHWDMLPDF
jgi:ankyrin repeat protein